MERKKRILMVNEASFLMSGYAKYGKEIFQRLYKTNKYELAEFAAYAKTTDIRCSQIPWKLYPNQPNDNSAEEMKVYQSNPSNQFGRFRFNSVLLDFKPDIVWCFRDRWMDQFIFEHPYRDFYHLSTMPTVDSLSQQEDWINDYITADSVFTYTDFSLKALQKEGGGKIPLLGTAHFGVDHNMFSPTKDKRKHKQEFGVDPNMLIIGTVMRNQKRKLFPDLFQAFRIYLDNCYAKGQHELANNTYLYCHTSFIDQGWCLPELLKQEGLCNKVLFSFLCKQCGACFPQFFSDIRTFCPQCKQYSATSPNVGTGVPNEVLAKIYNLFDVYVQYSIAGAVEAPVLEAASSAVYVMSTGYAGMGDATKNVEGKLIRIQKMFRELESHCKRVYPDNDHLADELYNFLRLPNSVRVSKGIKGRNKVLSTYTWDKVAKTWEDHFDGIELKNNQGQWDIPAKSINPNLNIPQNLNNSSFIDYVLTNILQEPIEKYHLLKLNLIRFLNYECTFSMAGYNMKRFTRQDVINILMGLVQVKNQCETNRINTDLDELDYIKFTNMDNK